MTGQPAPLTREEIDDIEGTIDAALEMTGPAMEEAGVAQWLTNTTFEALCGARRLVAHVRALHESVRDMADAADCINDLREIVADDDPKPAYVASIMAASGRLLSRLCDCPKEATHD